MHEIDLFENCVDVCAADVECLYFCESSWGEEMHGVPTMDELTCSDSCGENLVCLMGCQDVTTAPSGDDGLLDGFVAFIVLIAAAFGFSLLRGLWWGWRWYQ